MTKLPKPRKIDNEKGCTEDNFSLACSSIDSSNLRKFLNRDDVFYIDVRDFEEYSKNHLRNFELIPFFSMIWDENAGNDEGIKRLYGGSFKDPKALYKKSDKILEELFPKNKNIFLICQSGGRVAMLMNILKARGWDMSYIYNIGGMAQYEGEDYDDLRVGCEDIIAKASFDFKSLERI